MVCLRRSSSSLFAFPHVESMSAWNIPTCIGTISFVVSYWGKKWQVLCAASQMSCSSLQNAESSTDKLCSALIIWKQRSSLPAQTILLTLLLLFLLAFTSISLRPSVVPTSIHDKCLQFLTALQSVARPNQAAENDMGRALGVRMVQGKELESARLCCC